MDNLELKNTLQAQKIPFDEAVKQKIKYLESDDVFSVDDDQYITSMRNILPAQQEVDPFLSAFGANSAPAGNRPAQQPQRASAPGTSGKGRAPTANVPSFVSPSSLAPAQNKQMTMAERIAALRGALNVPQEFRHK